MASRALGAFLALATAAAFVVSIASSAWWAGHPVVDGKEIAAKHVYAGPIGATGCNTGGDGSCEPIGIASDIELIGYGTLGATALATLFALILLFAASRVSERRRGIALTSLLLTLVAAGAGGAMLALGPGIVASQQVQVPIGWGAFVFGGGVLSSLLASLITRKLEPEPLRLKSSRAPRQAAARDIREVQREQQQNRSRPSAPHLAPPAGLRPLYEQPQPHPPMMAPQPPMMAPQPPMVAPHPAMVATPVMTAPAAPAMPAASRPPAMTAPHLHDPSAPPAMTAPHLHDPSAPPAMTARSLPGMSPPSMTAPSLPGMTPPRAKAPSMPPPSPATRNKPPSEAPRRNQSPSEAPWRNQSPSGAPWRNQSPSDVPGPKPLGSDALRPKPLTGAPLGSDALRPKPATGAPLGSDALRPKPVTGAPLGSDALRPKGGTGAPFAKRPLVPPPAPGASIDKRPVGSSFDKRPVVPAPAPGAQVDKGPVVPGPRPSAAAKPLPGLPRPSQPRIPTQHATPPPALPVSVPANDGSGSRTRGSRPGIAQPAGRNPTIAHAVPPPPAEAAVDAEEPVAIAPKSRADTDARTGRSRIVEVTETGIPVAPPRAATDVEDAFGVREQTAQTLMAPEPAPPRDPEDLLKTFEQNPKTFEPSSTPLGQNPKTPIPTMDRPATPDETPHRAPHVPISTAPSTLPPPKQLESVPSGPTPACPQCEAPMAWVDEHLRFYCKQCRMYF